ncbi:MAG TPA: GntR family transcriptional regulator [Anaerolineales bacterium]|jgi:GntR family transcriptional regulator|nr:GntR family transcriptional regulator [Anaerolineales bacterium]
MKFKVDLTSHHPVYLQIIEQVKQAVATKELKVGDQLPTVRQLAADLRVNFNTVARAYRLLDEESIISTQHGRGTYILGPGSARESKRLKTQQLTLLVEHLVEEAERLGFSLEEVSEKMTEQIEGLEKARKEKKRTALKRFL